MAVRRHISTSKRVDLFLRHKGLCHLCGRKILPTEGWDVSHVIPLELGGDDAVSNWAPAHRKCHRVHTAKVDLPTIAKAKRREARHIGARAPSRTPLPCGRNSRWLKKISGEVVPR